MILHKDQLNTQYDVIIVGAGAAGLSAAIQANDTGACPVIFESMPGVKGNSIKASAGMNASQTKFQQAQGIEDSHSLFYEETLAGGNRTNDVELLSYFVEESPKAVDWLDSMDITLSSLTTTGGMSVKRTHRPSDGSAIGGYLMKGLMRIVEERGIPLFTSAEVTRLSTSEKNDQVDGVYVVIDQHEERFIKAETVVIATGGFGSNYKKIEEVAPDLSRLITTNHEGSQGSGIDMVKAVGGKIRDLDQIQIHPTVHQKSRFLMTEAIRGEGAILVSLSGNRFVNEMDRRDVVSQAIMDCLEQKAFLIFDEQLKERVPAIGFYESKNMVCKANDLRELAEETGIKKVELIKTVSEWNQSVTCGSDERFHRTTAMDHPIGIGPFYAIEVAPGIHHTMGGIKINTRTEVINENGEAINGLYAAGETCGGLHGENRIGGNAIAETIVFGRQAGKQAAEYVAKSAGDYGF